MYLCMATAMKKNGLEFEKGVCDILCGIMSIYHYAKLP